MGYASISFKGKSVIAIKPIEENEFDNFEQFGELARKQGLENIIVTQKAWSKYESILFPPEEMEKMKERIVS